MKIHRTKNAVNNIAVGLVLKIYEMLGLFIVRTVLIHVLGMEYMGLSSLFTSVLQVLNLVELGVGNAMVYSMYKPIANDDHKTICALMKLYKTYYRIIGLVVLILGLCLLPFINRLISGETPADVNIYILYLINLFATVFSYWIFAYKNCLLVSYQRTDLMSFVRIISNTVLYILQIAAIVVYKNYYLFAVAMLISQVFVNLLTAVIATRKFPEIKPEGKLPREEQQEINKHIKDLFTAKIGGVVTNSADSVVISAFLGLTILAQYNNYYYIMSAIFGVLTIVFNACLAGIGNSLVVESKEKNYSDFNKFSLLLFWIIGFCTVSLLCLYQPFMKLWVGEANMLDDSFVILFAFYFFIYEITNIWATYKDAGGIWHKDRYRPICVTLVNLVLNLILVQFIGLYGVLLSTVISYIFVGMPWMLHNIFTNIFTISIKKYICKVSYYSFATVVVCIVCSSVCNLLPFTGFVNLIIRALIVVFLGNIIFLLFYFRLKEFKQISNIFKNIISRVSGK